MAARQFNVISLPQLYELGFTYRHVQGLVTRGYLYPVHRAVYAIGHAKLSPWGRLKAASLACPRDSFLSHRTSAAALGLRAIAVRDIELTVVRGCPRPGLVIHRTIRPPHREDVTTRNGIRISSVPRMLIELAPRETPKELERLITLSARKHLLNVDAIERAFVRHARRPGVAKLKAAIRRYRPGPDRKSELERTFDRALARNPDIPPPLKNVTVHGWELDNYWPQYGLDVELDGRPYHIAVRDIEKDRYRDAKLLTRQIQTLRFTDFRIEYGVDDCLDDIRAVMKLAAA